MEEEEDGVALLNRMAVKPRGAFGFDNKFRSHETSSRGSIFLLLVCFVMTSCFEQRDPGYWFGRGTDEL